MEESEKERIGEMVKDDVKVSVGVCKDAQV